MISFRQQTWFDGHEYLWAPGQLDLVTDVFGVEATDLKDGQAPLYDRNAGGTQTLGSVVTPQGRLLTWPNAIQHRMEPFGLQDPSLKGHLRSVVGSSMFQCTFM